VLSVLNNNFSRTKENASKYHGHGAKEIHCVQDC